MSAVYFLGAKCGTKKKDSTWYGFCSLLFKNQYGGWTCDRGWFGSEDDFKTCVSGLSLGQSVSVFRDMAGHVVQLAENPAFPDLLIE